jgi:Zn-dependent protease with chaperone function
MGLTGWPLAFIAMSFLFLIIFSYYYLTRRYFLEGKLGLILISYVQGLILGVLFYSDNVFSLFASAIIFGVLYYLLFSKLIMLIEFLKNRLLHSFSAFKNHELTKAMAKLWNIPLNGIEISTYSGPNSLNAFTVLSLSKIEIFAGEQLASLLSKDEMIFVLSHEIAHQKNKRYMIYFVLFPVIFMVFCFVFIIIITLLGLLNVILFYILSIILYILGIAALNGISWANEYTADREGVLKTKDSLSAETMLTKLSETQKDYGTLNIIFYDHPLVQRRIEKLRACKF